MLFNKILIANSTLYWWMVFLLNAQEIYFPEGWLRNRLAIDLRVDNDDRYIYIKCNEEYRGTIIERTGHVFVV